VPLRDVPLRILLVAGFLLSGLLPLMAVALLGLSAAGRELHEQAFRQLESVRDIKKSQLERFFDERVALIEAIAADPATAEALAAFEVAIAPGDPGLAGHGRGRFDAPPAYRAAHDELAGRFATYAEKGGFYDLFLLDAARGFTFFTVAKEADFGVEIGADGASPLAEVWRIAAAGTRSAVSDTRPYAPSGVTPAQFIAAPIRRAGQVVGVLAAQIALDPIDAFMTERPGMGETGEVYLVGTDDRMRSDSHLEPVSHSVAASFRGSVERNGVRTEASRLALAGATGSREISDYRGVRVLSAFGPVDVHGTRWAIIAEIDAREIDAKIAAALDGKITLILVLSLGLLLLLALSIAALIARGIRRVIGELGLLIDGVLHGDLTARGDPDEVARDFRGVVDKTNDLVRAFAAKTEESRRLEEVVEVNQRIESIGTLAGGIAHDFNNILSYLYNYGDLVLARLAPGTQEHAHMVELLGGIDRASELVERLMAFGRRAKRERRVVKIAPILRESAALVRTAIQKNIAIETRVDDDSLAIFADPTQLHQVVMNLCTNAAHAMQGVGGVMTILAARSEEDGTAPGLPAGAYLSIAVRDTGCGIPKEIRDRIFEPFFTTKPVGQGTGMGLAVVHGIAASYGGAVLVDSAVGRGTEVRVLLPAGEVAPGPGEPAREDGDAVRGAGTLLLVDDEPQICASAAQVLASLGYAAEAFTSPVDALAAFAASPGRFTAAIADINMPDLDGVALATRLRALRGDLPILLSTGYDERLAADTVGSLGYAAVLFKPYKRTELSRALRDLLREATGAGST
jgi:signal transduction histidine kinase/ActR/RegA family two-component response regulator